MAVKSRSHWWFSSHGWPEGSIEPLATGASTILIDQFPQQWFPLFKCFQQRGTWRAISRWTLWNLKSWRKQKKNVVELTWKCHSASVAIDWTFTVPSLYTVYNISTRRHDQSHCCPNHFFRAVSFQFQTICPSSHSKTGIPAAPLRSCMRPFWNSCRSSDVRDVAINKYFRHQITKLHDSFLAGNKCKILQKCLYMLVPYLGPT